MAASSAAAMLVSGCGFRPLYGAKSLGDVASELGQVKVGIIRDRVGQQLHNYLLDRTNPRGRPKKPLYLLSVDADVERVRQAFEPDGTATRIELIFRADFKLEEIVTEEVLLISWARSVTSYNILDSAIATRSAELDAIDRTAREVSDQIHSLLAMYFQRRAAELKA